MLSLDNAKSAVLKCIQIESYEKEFPLVPDYQVRELDSNKH